MKIGSIVICEDNNPFKTDNSTIMFFKGYSFPELNTEYVVRGFQTNGRGGFNETNILLEEIVNKPVNCNGGLIAELGFGSDRFREILPPQTEEIESLMNAVNSMPLFSVHKTNS